MPTHLLGRPVRCAARTSLALASFFAAACSSSGGGGGDCTTCPQPTDAALRIHVEFDALSRGLNPSGFRLQDLSRIDIEIQGGIQGSRTLPLTPPQDAAFVNVFAGAYQISATGFGASDLVLFRSAPQNVSLAKGDTATVALPMLAELGEVTLQVGGALHGAIEAKAGEDVSFVVTVRNTQGRPVPSSAVVVTSTNGFGSILFEGSNATDAEGRVAGVVRAQHKGVIGGFKVQIDGRPVSVPSDLQVEFATAVDPAKSAITEITNTACPPCIIADGQDSGDFTVIVRNAKGDPLPGVPVTATSSRNTGVDPSVDTIRPRPGHESGKTDDFGRFSFSVQSRTSSFMELDSQGRLFSPRDAGRTFVPATIQIFADGLQIDQRDVTFNSVVNPADATLNVSPQPFVAVGSSALITVNVRALATFGGGPAAGVFVELSNTNNQAVNYVYDIRPEPGFDGFRTNAQGVWRGRIHSSVPLNTAIGAKADGRALMVDPPRTIIFQ